MLKYTGNKDGHGWALANVPARDLTDQEVAAQGGPDALVATGLYEARQLEEKPAASEPHVIISSTGG